MCRYIKAEYLIGNALIKAQENNRNSISFETLYTFEEKINMLFYQNINAVIEMSIKEIYAAAEIYSDMFYINDESIIMTDQAYNSPFRLNAFFRKGLPEDIVNVFDKAMVN